jgi:hypothetical protein
MQEESPKKAETKTDQKAAEKHGIAISKGLAGLLEVIFGIFGTIFLTVGASYLPDTQYRGSGIFFMAAAGGFYAAVAFTHARHRYLDRRFPALKTTLLLDAWIVAFIALGSSSWWFIAFKDADSFHVVAGGAQVSDLTKLPKNVPSEFSAASALGTEAVLNPISRLIFLQVTNLKSAPTKIIGVSVKVKSTGWWPSWIEMCHVDLSSSQLVILNKPNSGVLITPELMLDRDVNRTLQPTDSVQGWSAWECPAKSDCSSKSLEVGIEDVTGAMSWHSFSDSPILPTAQKATLNFAQEISIPSPVRTVHSCIAR